MAVAATAGGGRSGQAFSPDGTGGSAEALACASLNVGAGAGLTVEGWINPVSNTVEEPIVEWNNGSAIGVHFWISVPPSPGTGPGCLYANLLDTAGNNHYFASAAGLIASNAFQHVAVTYDGKSGVADLYINGETVAQKTLGVFTPQTSFGNFNLGYRPGYYFGGRLDEISVYNRAPEFERNCGRLLCRSSGKCAVTSANLDVPPIVTVQPSGQLVQPGGGAVFSAVAVGSPPLGYRWQFNGSNLNNGGGISGATTTTLLVSNITVSAAGIYTLLVTNSSAAAVSDVQAT